MRLLQILTAALLPLTSLAAQKASGDRFSGYYAKQLSASAPLKIDDTAYAELTKWPRDYAVAVLLTALEAKYQCGLCRDFAPEWELLGKTWTRGDKAGESRLIFGTLDIKDGSRTFQAVRITSTSMRGFIFGY